MSHGAAPAPIAGPRQRPLAAALWLLVIVGALSAFCAVRFRVTTDITHFLPSGSDAWPARVLKQLSRSALGQRMILVLSSQGGDADALARASAELADRLGKHPELLRVQRGVPEDAQRQLFELYFPHRHQLYSGDPEREYAALLSDPGLAQAAGNLTRALGGVQGPFIRRIAERDPLLAFPRLLDRLQAARDGGLVLRDGAFFTADGTRAVLFVETRAPALDSAAQRDVLAQLASDFDAVRRAHGPGLTLESSGVNRYAVHAEQAISADIQRVSMLSTVALLLLFLVLFRSLRALLFVAATPLFAVLVATAATLAVFGTVHGATLAFGATLIGVSVDFPVHLLGHHVLGPATSGGHATLRAIWPAIRLGALTTVAGLLGLSLAAFPGIREMAFFSGVGVVGSLLLTRFALPHFLGQGGQSNRSQRAIAAWLAGRVAALRARPIASWSLLALALLLCAAGLPRMRFQDDLANWVPAPAGLRAEDERVRNEVLGSQTGRLLITSAPDMESALAANDRLAGLLAEAQRAGEIDGYRSLHALLFSEQLQRRNQAALNAAPALPERLTHALDAAGFTPEAFAPFFDELAHPPPPLRLPALLDSSLAPIASALVLDLDGTPALLTHLRGVRDRAALERRLAPATQTRYFDQREFLSDTYAKFRVRTVELLGVGLLVVFLIILVRYRALRPTLAALLPAVLAAAGALALLALCGITLDLFHVIGVLLVLSMGEDYGVFLVESAAEPSLPATLLGLLLACASTVLSFGLLAMSAIPALRSLGQVISVGMLLSLVWAPAGLVLLKPARGGH